MVVLKKLKIGLPCDPPLLGLCPIKLKAGSGRYGCTPMFTAALFIITKRWKLPNVHQQMSG